MLAEFATCVSRNWGGAADPHLVDRAGMQAECRWVQTSGRVTQVGLFNPQEGGTVLAFLALVVVATLKAHEEQRDEEDAEDWEGVEEDEIEEGLIGTYH